MRRLEHLEPQSVALDNTGIKAFREWFATYYAERWDQQLASDADNGNLARVASQALHDYEAGKATEW